MLVTWTFNFWRKKKNPFFLKVSTIFNNIWENSHKKLIPTCHIVGNWQKNKTFSCFATWHFQKRSLHVTRESRVCTPTSPATRVSRSSCDQTHPCPETPVARTYPIKELSSASLEEPATQTTAASSWDQPHSSSVASSLTSAYRSISLFIVKLHLLFSKNPSLKKFFELTARWKNLFFPSLFKNQFPFLSV